MRVPDDSGRAGGQPEVSVIIVSYNTVDHLRRCLTSIAANPSRRPIEVVVVDNASPDGSADMVQSEFPSVRLVRRATNDGYGVALNFGVGATTGRRLMFLNPDIEVIGGAIDELCDFSEAHVHAGVVGPRLELTDGRPQASAQHFRSPWRLLLEGTRLHLLLPANLRGRLLLGIYDEQTETRRVPWISGACHVIARPVWDDIGPLTQETFCGFDDYDYCFRARSKGYEVWQHTASRMTHHCSAAVRDRWSRAEVEQVAIHNTFVVIQGHWPWWRVKAVMAAELLTGLADWMRVQTRLGADSRDEQYGNRLRQRLGLFARLLVGRQCPIRRFQGAGPSSPDRRAR